MAPGEYGPYVVTQFVAAVIAGLLVRYVGGREPAVVASNGKMLIVEFIYTFALAWVVLHVATARRHLRQLVLRPCHRLHGGNRRVGGRRHLRQLNPAIAVGACVTGLFEWSNVWILPGRRLPRRRCSGEEFAFLYVLPAEKEIEETSSSKHGVTRARWVGELSQPSARHSLVFQR